MGIYYILAAWNDMKEFYAWTVPFRTLTFGIFTTIVLARIAPLRFVGVGIWELVGGLATGVALYAERRASNRVPKGKPYAIKVD
jgi:hypothetical protein